MLLMVCYHGFAAHSAYPWSSMKANLIVLTAMLASLVLFFGAGADTEKADPAQGVTLYFFWGEGCPHCESAKPFLKELQAKYPALQIKSWEVLEHRENIPLLMEMAEARHHEATGVPVFIIGDSVVSGFGKETGGEIEALVHSALARAEAKGAQQKLPTADSGTVSVPLLGKVDSRTASLPVLTIIIASLDSFNPCAFFVLFFLLSLLIHAHSRRRMLLIGGIFVFFSGLVYFVFMAAWLNLFLFTGTLPAVTVAAGVIALLVAVINIKDFFYFEQGISLVIPEARKPKLFERMRNLLKAGSTLSLVTGTAILALAANSYELLCTAGFPMVYTRMLTLHQLSTPMYYLYLALYNLVYIVPLAIIVTIFTVTLGSRKLTEWQGRVLKLISGLMMLGLGLVLLINPSLLNNPVASAGLLGATLAMAAMIILAWKQVTRR
jgi:thiol-disulfide isomerase/thioredoxin